MKEDEAYQAKQSLSKTQGRPNGLTRSLSGTYKKRRKSVLIYRLPEGARHSLSLHCQPTFHLTPVPLRYTHHSISTKEVIGN